jgi:pilus assembly protein TadC
VVVAVLAAVLLVALHPHVERAAFAWTSAARTRTRIRVHVPTRSRNRLWFSRHHDAVARLRARANAAGRREARLRAAPLVIDLLRLALEAGATPLQACELVATAAPNAGADSFRRVVAECRLGRPPAEALGAVATVDAEFGRVARVLAVGVRLGAPIAPVLARHAEQARAARRRAMQQRARTVPVRLLFPLVFLVLPAFGLLTVVPTLIAGWHAI